MANFSPAQTRAKVLRFIEEDLGFDPIDVANVLIVPESVSVEVLLRDEDGEFYFTPERLPAATLITIPLHAPSA